MHLASLVLQWTEPIVWLQHGSVVAYSVRTLAVLDVRQGCERLDAATELRVTGTEFAIGDYDSQYNYIADVAASTSAGTGPYSDCIIVPAAAAAASTSSTGAIVGGVLGAVAACVLIAVVAFLLVQRRKQASLNLMQQQMLGSPAQESIGLAVCVLLVSHTRCRESVPGCT